QSGSDLDGARHGGSRLSVLVRGPISRDAGSRKGPGVLFDPNSPDADPRAGARRPIDTCRFHYTGYRPLASGSSTFHAANHFIARPRRTFSGSARNLVMAGCEENDHEPGPPR